MYDKFPRCHGDVNKCTICNRYQISANGTQKLLSITNIFFPFHHRLRLDIDQNKQQKFRLSQVSHSYQHKLRNSRLNFLCTQDIAMLETSKCESNSSIIKNTTSVHAYRRVEGDTYFIIKFIHK